MGSRICRVQIFPHIIDLTNSNDQGGGFIGFAKRIVHPFSDTEPDCYLNSNAPADLFNISVFPAGSNGMRTPRRGRPYERNADAWVFRKSSAPLLSNSPFHGFTNARYHYGDVKRCGDFDCFVSCFLQFCANCIVMALARAYAVRTTEKQIPHDEPTRQSYRPRFGGFSSLRIPLPPS